jgi:hypothetical protein
MAFSQEKYYLKPAEADISSLLGPSNALRLHQGIAKLFFDNKIGVDVDVCFLS